VLTTTTPSGTTTYTYGDSAHPGDVTTVTDPDGHQIGYTYDSRGDVTSQTVTPSSGFPDVTRWVDDADGEPVCQVQPLLSAAGVTCPAAGAARASWTITTGYDGDGRPTSVTDTMGHTSATVYDADGNATQVTDPLGNQSTTRYDADDRATSVTAGANGTSPSTTSTAYDIAAGSGACTGAVTGATYCTTSTDANGDVTVNYYDAGGRLIATTRPGGQMTSYGYDAAGNQTTLLDPNGQTTTTGYDADNRPVSVSYSDGTTHSVSYTYTADGQRASMSDGTGTTTYSYDTSDRLTSTLDGNGKTVGYGYDPDGNITTLTYPNSQQVTRTFDGARQLTSVTDWNGNATTFGYDRDGNPTTATQPSGDLVYSTFDLDDQMTYTGLYTAAHAGLYGIAYTRDADEQITQEHAADVSASAITNYAYDAQNRLTTAGARTYSYDPAGNPTAYAGTNQTFNNRGEITTSGNYTIAHDANGNLTSSTVGTLSATLTYDQANRLTTGTLNGAQSTAYSYTYNGDGLRATAGGWAGAATFTWNTQAGIPELLADGTNYYIYGPAGHVIEQLDTAGNPTYLFHDALGSTRTLTDTTGTVTAEYAYDPYGKTLVATGTGTTPIRYTGAYLDPTSNLYYLINRYYNPTDGQFLTLDPALTTTGQPYTYTNDNPVNRTDSVGLFGCGFLSSACHVAVTVWNETGGMLVHEAATHPLETIGLVAGAIAAVTGVGALADVGIASLFTAEATETISFAAGVVASLSDLPGCILGGEALSCVGAVTGGVAAGLGGVAAGLDRLFGDAAETASGLLNAKGYSIGVGAGGWDFATYLRGMFAC
jgi:RHS repeat-associated protein